MLFKILKKVAMFLKMIKVVLFIFLLVKFLLMLINLHENLATFVKAFVAAKPATSKGKFLKKMTVSSTMGVGIPVNPDEVLRS